MTASIAARPRSPAAPYWTGFAVVVALLVIAPLVLPPFWQRFATEILIWGLLAMSSDILIGYTGMVSFVVLVLTMLFRPTGLFVPTPK